MSDSNINKQHREPAPDKRVGPLELFFDLVFVFALTQVTARLAVDLTVAGLLRGLLVLAAIWWAWAAYAWLTNEVDGRRPAVRLAIFGAMATMLLASLAIPGAFEDDALLFAGAYLGVRVLHILLFAAGTADTNVRQAARALAPTAVIAPALLIVAALIDDSKVRLAIWVVALGIDYVGGAVRGIEGWKLSPGHFAERHSLIVIIALGESIVAVGAGAVNVELDLGALAAASLGVTVAAALWWTYFDETLEEVEQRLQQATGRMRNVVARDAFSFLHLPLVTGIVLFALGVKKALGDVTAPLEAVAAVGLCCGCSLFFGAGVAFRRRTLGTVEFRCLAAAAVCGCVTPLATLVPAVASLVIIAVSRRV